MQERPDSRIQPAGHPFTRNRLKTATASGVGLALAHVAIKGPATEWTDSMYDASLIRIQELALCGIRPKISEPKLRLFANVIPRLKIAMFSSLRS